MKAAPALRTPEQLKPVSSYLPAELSAIFVTANTPQERAQHFQGAADLVLGPTQPVIRAPSNAYR